jgi:hypothetical protein
MKSYKKPRKNKQRKTRKHQKGGTNPSFQGLPIRYYYDINDYNSDPIRAAVNARLSGGRKRKSSKNTPRQRGGFIGFSNYPFLGTTSFNLPASFGSVPFAYIGENIQSGNITSQFPQNPSTIQQPGEMKYNYNNPPLA